MKNYAIHLLLSADFGRSWRGVFLFLSVMARQSRYEDEPRQRARRRYVTTERDDADLASKITRHVRSLVSASMIFDCRKSRAVSNILIGGGSLSVFALFRI